jgi:hypothetical protein
MLVTFVAVVLGLLTTSVKASFDQVGNELKGLSVALIQLDRSLRQWSAEAETARQLLRDYTAAVIAGTWRQEPMIPSNDVRQNVLPGLFGPVGVRRSARCFPASNSISAGLSLRIRCSGGSRLPASPSLSG